MKLNISYTNKIKNFTQRIKKNLERYVLVQLVLLFDVFITRYSLSAIASEVAFFSILAFPAFIISNTWIFSSIAKLFSLNLSNVNDMDGDTQILALLRNDKIFYNLKLITSEILSNQHYGSYSIAALAMFFSGPQLLRVYLNGISTIYGSGKGRFNFFRTKFFTFAMQISYILLMVIYQSLLSFFLVQLVSLRHSSFFVFSLLLTTSLIFAIVVITTLYFIALPRTGIAWHLPGTLFSLVVSVIGTFFLSIALKYFLHAFLLLGLFTIPLSILIWLYLLAISSMLGAIYNRIFAYLRSKFGSKYIKYNLPIFFKKIDQEDIENLKKFKKTITTSLH